jgi:SAM-dependent methyltransferase
MDIRVFLENQRVPVHCNVLWPTRPEAIKAPKGELRLGFCGNCGHVFNLVFDPSLTTYTQEYENSLHFSPRFQAYAESLAAHLIERYGLHGKDIVEIGCGKGDFLRLLCDLGGNRGVGFDPSYEPGPDDAAVADRIMFIQDFYSEQYASIEADFICSRHTLEHIQFPRDFMVDVRQAVGDRSGTVVFFEVPNVAFTLRDMGIWDLIYEHCHYFSASSLARLFRSCGFEACDLTETYGGQFLCVEAVPGERQWSVVSGQWSVVSGAVKEMARHVAAFREKYQRKLDAWRRDLKEMERTGQQAVIWGAGSKGVTFLNALEARDEVRYAVDINPRKQGKFLAGTGQRIVPPESLREVQPDVVIVMNPIYEGEIRACVQDLGLKSKIMVA